MPGNEVAVRVETCWRLPLACASTRGKKKDSASATRARSEEHTSELQSRLHLVCRLLLEKKKQRHQKQNGPQGRRHQHLHLHHRTIAHRLLGLPNQRQADRLSTSQRSKLPIYWPAEHP